MVEKHVDLVEEKADKLNKVLIVDDEPDILEILRGYLIEYKFEVDTATRGMEAIELVKNNEYLFVITDYEMPDMNGLDLISAIRIIRPLLPTCISSSRVNEYSKGLVNIAVSSSLSKPYKPEDIRECVDTLAHRSKLYTEINPREFNTVVKDIMSKNILTFLKETKTKDVINGMTEINVGSALITDEDNKLIGIFTERDIMRKIVANYDNFLNEPIEKFMTGKIKCVNQSASIETASFLMEVGNFRHIPITDNQNHPVGIISIRDINHSKISNLQLLVEGQTEKIKTLLNT